MKTEYSIVFYTYQYDYNKSGTHTKQKQQMNQVYKDELKIINRNIIKSNPCSKGGKGGHFLQKFNLKDHI